MPFDWLKLLTAACVAGDTVDNYFRQNTAANGAGVWQNNCPKLTHSHNQFDSNTAAQVHCWGEASLNFSIYAPSQCWAALWPIACTAMMGRDAWQKQACGTVKGLGV